MDENKKSLTQQIPSNLPPIFDGTRLLAYYTYPSESTKPSVINIKADTPNGLLSVDINVTEANILHERGIVRKLAARKKIQELEESINVDYVEYDYEERQRKNDIKKKIIKLGLENSLASQYTSFIGIDNTTRETLADEPMWTREIKNQLASGFGGMRGTTMSTGGKYINSQDEFSFVEFVLTIRYITRNIDNSFLNS